MNASFCGALLGALTGMALFGSQLVSAKVIPGVDEPFDPPNYYSLFTVSYADSPSPFAIRELLSGQNVQKIHANSVNKILDNLNIVLNSKEFQMAVQLANAVIHADGDGREFIKYMKGPIADEMKNATKSMGLGENEQNLMNGFIDASLDFDNKTAIKEFAKKVVKQELTSLLKEELKKQLTSPHGCFGSIMIAGGINGAGNVDIPAEDVVGYGTPVYDALREVQTVLENEKTLALLGQFGIKLGKFQEIFAILPDDIKTKHTSTFEEIQKKTKEMQHAPGLDYKTVFMPSQREHKDYIENGKPYLERQEAVNDEYMALVESMKKNQEGVEDISKALKSALEDCMNASGETDAEQAKAVIDALQSEMKVRKAIALSQWTQLQALKQQWQLSQERENKVSEVEALRSFEIDDPFDEGNKRMLKKYYGWEKHEVHMMPDFE